MTALRREIRRIELPRGFIRTEGTSPVAKGLGVSYSLAHSFQQGVMEAGNIYHSLRNQSREYIGR